MTNSLPVHPEPAPRRRARLRLVAAGGAALVFVLGATITMAASPSPSSSAAPDSTADPSADGLPGFGPFGGRMGVADGFAGFGGRHGGIAGGRISIAAINGSSLSLETLDGWTRTITVTDATTITKDGATIALSDLSVGDRIRLRQTVEDGTYTVTAIDVVVPTVVGQVTAVDGDSITLQQPDGTSVTVHVDGSTAYAVAGETGKALSDVEIGMVAAAAGEERADGSLDASTVHAGSIWQRMGRDGGRGGHGPWGVNPAPTASPESSSNDG